MVAFLSSTSSTQPINQRVGDIESGLINQKSPRQLSSSQSTGSSDSDGRNCCCKSFFQGIIFVVCCFLFVTQSMMLIKVYNSFPTTITTNLTFDEIFDLPSVTLCFKSDLKPGSIEQAIEVFKRNFNADDKSNKDEDIKCNLMIPTINSVTGLSEVSPVPCNEIVPAVESINFGLGKKCYTFFSKLGKPTRSSRELKVKLPRYQSGVRDDDGSGLLTTKNGDLLTLEIEFGRKHVVDPLTINDDIDASLSIHQSNELPLGSQKISKLKPGYNYLVTFDKIIEKRMPPPFRTGCDQYKNIKKNKEKVNQPANDGNLNGDKQTEDDLADIVSLHSHKSPRSKYDCVDQCLLTLYRETCNCLPSDINVRRDLLRSTDTFCTNSKCQSLQIHRAEFCATLPRCKPNCEDEVYNFVTEVADSQSTSMVLSHYINSQKHRTSIPSQSRPTNYNGGSYIMGRPMIANNQFQSYGLQEAGTYHGSLTESASDIVNVLGSLSKAFVTVRKSSGPDVVYEHRPQYNYFDFIFQLMTLACVWLGFSVFSLLYKPFYIIFKIISFCFCLFTRNSRQTKPLINVD